MPASLDVNWRNPGKLDRFWFAADGGYDLFKIMRLTRRRFKPVKLLKVPVFDYAHAHNVADLPPILGK
jgi:hypothetical protein